VIGFAVCDDSEYFTNRIDKINQEAGKLAGKEWNYNTPHLSTTGDVF
jgi:hypothetical protein